VILGSMTEGLIEIVPEVEVIISAYVSDREILMEAGGILIGNYRGPHVVVEACTTPYSRDCRRRHLFDRQDPGHQAAALDAWKRSGGTDTFVGEWHTHPVDHPTPSGLDLQTWHAVLRRTSEPLVFLIAGRFSFWCGIGRDGRVRRLTTLSSA
jgi:integrative and conjugative element protein (TIGR02256 family)